MPDFNPALPKAPKVYDAREKPERGTPLGLIRKPLAEPEMVPIRKEPPGKEALRLGFETLRPGVEPDA